MKHNIRKVLYQPIKKRIILITGQHQSGKSFVNKLVCSLKESNISIIDYHLENLLNFYKFNQLNDANFEALINLYLNQYLVNKNLGRYLNFRRLDEGSIFLANKSKVKSIFKNLFSNPSKKSLIKKIKHDNEIILQLHNAIHCSELLFSSLKNLKIINVINNPIDQIFSIYRKHIRFGNIDSKNSLIAAEFLYSFKKKMYSEHAFKIEKNFNRFNRLQKILNSKLIKDFFDRKNLKLIKKKKLKVINIPYEDFFLKREFVLKKICKFLKKKVSIDTNKLLESKEYILRKNEILKIKSKEKFLLRKFNNVDKVQFKKIIQNYEYLF